ncbi:hypothetical protein ACIBK8_17210 [Streptomyces sp. NPDC050161]|uniref:hypothetical protein n=1 Tax=Streptomyces sp. NPDC050161 TaxID=3365604 RepID=UPI003798A7C0
MSERGVVGAVRRCAGVLVMGWLAVLLACGAAQAAGPAAGAQARASAAVTPSADAPPGRTAYVAGQLRKNPVYISDQMPREVPRSTAPDFAAQAKRLGVPVYVMVMPDAALSVDGAGFIAGVHDRLGRAGLYVVVSGPGMPQVQTYGVDLPGAEDAARATLYGLSYDATPRESFHYFVDVLASGKAHERYVAARAEYGGDDSSEPPKLHIGLTDRRNQSFVSGIAITGIPLSALLVAAYVRRRRRLRHTPADAERIPAARGGRGPAASGVTLRKPGATGGKPGAAGGKPGRGPAPATQPDRGRTTRRVRASTAGLLLAALALSGALAFTASQVFDERTSGDGSHPTAADMRARADRVAAGLRRDPLYTDPESEPVLGTAERARLRKHLAALHVPVLIAAVPSLSDDESGGDAELFAKSLHDRLRRDAVLVVADPLSGSIDVVNYGAPVSTPYLDNRPEYLSVTSSEDHALGSRLDKLLGYVAKSPPAEAGSVPYAPEPADDPVDEQALPGLFTTDFGPGLLIGALLAVAVLGLVALGRAVGGVLVRRVGRRAGSAAAPGTPTPPDAPDEPSTAWLRRTARQEVDALTAALETASELPEQSRRQAWECLDAAALLIDGDSDGRIDADAPPASLACAIALALAGRAAVAGPAAPQQLCHRNPLHGVAHGTRRIRPPGSGRARSLPVCAACRGVPGKVLRLGPTPDAGRDGRVPYSAVPGPLAALADGAGIDQLTRDVREYFGVH